MSEFEYAQECKEPPHPCKLCGDDCNCYRDEEGICQLCDNCNGDNEEE